MPLYEYQVREGEQGCGHCTPGFTVLQGMKEDALSACPQCGAPVRRLLFPVGVATPHTNSELKNLGFTKLVKRDDGVYENVTRRGSESRYMERGKSETMPDVSKIISD